MSISKDKVVSFHYVLHDLSEDLEIERSHDSEPMAYLHGHNNMIVGLERALEGKSPGDALSVSLEPDQAYGEREQDATQRLSRKYLPKGKLVVGQQVKVNSDDGMRMVTVLKVGLKTVDVDLNHPLAGKSLRFDVDIVEVRDATEEELAHGHAHGPGGHQHD